MLFLRRPMDWKSQLVISPGRSLDFVPQRQRMTFYFQSEFSSNVCTIFTCARVNFALQLAADRIIELFYFCFDYNYEISLISLHHLVWSFRKRTITAQNDGEWDRTHLALGSMRKRGKPKCIQNSIKNFEHFTLFHFSLLSDFGLTRTAHSYNGERQKKKSLIFHYPTEQWILWMKNPDTSLTASR